MEECLRFDAPLHLFTRYALSDTDYAGIPLRQSDVIGMLMGAANRDPSRFADAGSF
ncbi:MAG: cytochrome P450 [Candidatus Devosia euplotis]|nr:cytochrome P450 [Candidatus Devosia euplotis]